VGPGSSKKKKDMWN